MHCKTCVSKCLFSLLVWFFLFVFLIPVFLSWANTRHYLPLQSFRTIKSHEQPSVLEMLLGLLPALLYKIRRSETLKVSLKVSSLGHSEHTGGINPANPTVAHLPAVGWG